MATCANCIHHSLCDYNTNISGNGKVRLVYAEGADVKCSFFQNTADVAPKSEVAREIFEEIEKIINEPFAVGFNLLAPLKQALNDYNNGIRKYLLYYVAELKKKYTEDKG